MAGRLRQRDLHMRRAESGSVAYVARCLDQAPRQDSQWRRFDRQYQAMPKVGSPSAARSGRRHPRANIGRRSSSSSRVRHALGETRGPDRRSLCAARLSGTRSRSAIARILLLVRSSCRRRVHSRWRLRSARGAPTLLALRDRDAQRRRVLCGSRLSSYGTPERSRRTVVGEVAAEAELELRGIEQTNRLPIFRSRVPPGTIGICYLSEGQG